MMWGRNLRGNLTSKNEYCSRQKDDTGMKPRYIKAAMPTPGMVDQANCSISWKGKKKRYIQTVLNTRDMLVDRRRNVKYSNSLSERRECIKLSVEEGRMIASSNIT